MNVNEWMNVKEHWNRNLNYHVLFLFDSHTKTNKKYCIVVVRKENIDQSIHSYVEYVERDETKTKPLKELSGIIQTTCIIIVLELRNDSYV